jgi:3-hydroxyacyl-CoA dehydrogenase
MEVKELAAIGAGLMGSGIAQVAAQNGLEANLMDRESRFLDKGISSGGEANPVRDFSITHDIQSADRERAAKSKSLRVRMQQCAARRH